MKTIKVSCHRVDPSWAQMSSAELAAAISAESSELEPITLTTAFGEAVAAGAVVAELAQMWKYGEFIATLRKLLHDGDIAGVQNMILSGSLMTENGAVIWSQTTVDALNAVVASHAYTIRPIDLVANEMGETAPETVSEADVTTALNNAGYNWDQNTETWIKA